MNIWQRQGYLPGREMNTELDAIYQQSNKSSFPIGKEISLSYTATINDRLLELMQPGLTITLPSLNAAADGFTLSFQDLSGGATADPHTILPNTGGVIATAGGDTIDLNYAFISLRWKASLNLWLKVG